jgi:hypothetical protein
MFKKILCWLLVVAFVAGINVGAHFVWLDLGILVNLVTFFCIGALLRDADERDWWADVRRRHNHINNEAVRRLRRQYTEEFRRREISSKELEARFRFLQDEHIKEPCE